MSEATTLLLSFFAGGALGALFFGGLWWTVSRGLSARQPALWFAGSFVFRAAAVLAGLYFLGRNDWERLLASLLGFVMARFLILRLSRNPAKPQEPAAKEACHAP